MQRTGVRKLAAAAAVSALTLAGLAACGDDSGGDSSSGSSDLTKVTLQLQWVTQAQFAGYIEALAQGYYEDQGLDVDIVPAGTDTVPQLTVDDGGSADYAIAWTPKALQSREQGANITNIGQVFQRSGTLQISFKDSGINSVADLKGKNVGSWGFGNEFELYAGMTKAGLDPAKDVKVVQQAFDMNGFLNGDIDAAQAMIYNEYAQVLEATNPDTGDLYTPDDLNVINWNDEGTAMLQDAIWANTTKLQDPDYQKTTVAFLTASYQGWIACAQDPEQCRDDVVAAGSELGASHQLWQMNEVNQLIWPSPDGIGMMDPDAWKQTVQVALTTQNGDGDTVITKDPDADAYTTDYTEQALENLKGMGLDTTGADYQPIDVTLEEGGK
ncbi:ABC transporter substrate-binding protein [Nocardioides panacisoli]|uniref:Thiamine pyrimidine synthase n=1 Tax=Nocardioides panacisoli TaxID=627624 RepID=A0ABP7ILG9_9ACTN